MAEIKGKRQRSMLLFCLLMIVFRLQAQEATFTQRQNNPYYQQYFFTPSKGGVQRLQPSQPFTSLALSFADERAFNNYLVIVEQDTFRLQKASHQPEMQTVFFSELLIFDRPVKHLEIFSTSGKLSGKRQAAQIHLMYAAPVKAEQQPNNRARQQTLACEEPETISQSVWREGLPEPNYTRTFNEVSHLIVHHSATTNQARNFTEVVRNIYLYHTQANGWSDIGYNYLIAPDGTIFDGRDPAGGEQDNVRGAHFCGQNSQTMGVCLLGDYSQEVAPTAQAMESLTRLLAWKSLKEQLDPEAVLPHPANPVLPVIAGHRDGCATVCPGEQVYRQLPAIRTTIEQMAENCGEGEAFVYFAAKAQEVCIGGVEDTELGELQFFDVQGKKVDGFTRLGNQAVCFKAGSLAPGLYILQFERSGNIIRKKFIFL